MVILRLLTTILKPLQIKLKITRTIIFILSKMTRLLISTSLLCDARCKSLSLKTIYLIMFFYANISTEVGVLQNSLQVLQITQIAQVAQMRNLRRALCLFSALALFAFANR